MLLVFSKTGPAIWAIEVSQKIMTSNQKTWKRWTNDAIRYPLAIIILPLPLELTAIKQSSLAVKSTPAMYYTLLGTVCRQPGAFPPTATC